MSEKCHTVWRPVALSNNLSHKFTAKPDLRKLQTVCSCLSITLCVLCCGRRQKRSHTPASTTAKPEVRSRADLPTIIPASTQQLSSLRPPKSPPSARLETAVTAIMCKWTELEDNFTPACIRKAMALRVSSEQPEQQCVHPVWAGQSVKKILKTARSCFCKSRFVLSFAMQKSVHCFVRILFLATIKLFHVVFFIFPVSNDSVLLTSRQMYRHSNCQ